MAWKEILWNLVNAFLAALLVFIGGCAAKKLDWAVVVTAGIAGLVVFVTKFAEYWAKEEAEYSDSMNKKGQVFSFLPSI